jgi:hypothetical protein
MPTPWIPWAFVSFRRVLPEALDERGGAAPAPGDHENRVVAGDGANGLGHARPIERFGQHLRLAAPGPDDDELLHAFDAVEEFGGRALERRERALGVERVGAGALIGAVAGALDEPEFLDVARNRRLGRFEAALVQAAAQPFLAVKRFAVDELEDDRLAA